MSQKSRSELLHKLRYDYRQTPGKKARGELISLWCRVSGHERKYAIKELSGQRGAKPPGAKAPAPRGGSAARYSTVVISVLKALWLLGEQPCGKRLKALVPLWLESWERRHGALTPQDRAGVQQISASHIDRVLAPFRSRVPRKPRPGHEVRSQVPVRSGPWSTSGPGWVAVDTVAHCGGNMGGSFLWSVCLTDIYSGWTEVRATWNRNDRVVHAALEHSRQSLPFHLRGYHSDNGGEVLNHTVTRWLAAFDPPVEQTRSRPYRKNDNAHAEQKNLTHIRLLLGWGRIGCQEAAASVNALLEKWSLWNNLFSPSLKLASKEREGTRLIKKWERSARTPAQRVLDTLPAGDPGREKLTGLLARHDPIELKEQIEAQLREVFQSLARLEAAEVSTPA